MVDGPLQHLRQPSLISESAVLADSGIVMVDGTSFGDSFEQDRTWDDSGTTISGISGTHQNSVRVRMPLLIVAPRVNNR